MPYDRISELPGPVKSSVPSKAGRTIFMRVVNERLASGAKEGQAFASAWAALRRAGYKKDGEVWVKKRQLTDNSFTTQADAAARSYELGFGGAIHSYELSDGEVAWMPGPTHEAFLARMGVEDSPVEVKEPSMSERVMGALGALFSALVEKGETEAEIGAGSAGAVLKVDEEQHVVYGWASVISEKGEPVTDLEGDVISPEELTKATNAFMLSVRAAKAMHQGETVGEVIHSLPLTAELSKALGLVSDREGWIVGMKIHDDATWARVKSGELAAFSIGGRGQREAI